MTRGIVFHSVAPSIHSMMVFVSLQMIYVQICSGQNFHKHKSSLRNKQNRVNVHFVAANSRPMRLVSLNEDSFFILYCCKSQFDLVGFFLFWEIETKKMQKFLLTVVGFLIWEILWKLFWKHNKINFTNSNFIANFTKQNINLHLKRFVCIA